MVAKHLGKTGFPESKHSISTIIKRFRLESAARVGGTEPDTPELIWKGFNASTG